jgi:hypothetical protein
MLTEGIDFVYLYPKEDTDSVHIKLLNDPYDGVVFKFGKVKVEEKDEQAYLHFEFHVIESYQIKPKKLEKDEDFKNFIGEMLVEIISSGMQEQLDENGTAYIEESDI